MTPRQGVMVMVSSASCLLEACRISDILYAFVRKPVNIMPAPTLELAGLVAGIDTHTDTHTVAIVTETGKHLATETFPTTSNGYHQLTDFLTAHHVTVVGVEGTNSYGAAITRHLIDHGYEVFEVLRPTRALRRRDGKSDPVDALAAARQVLTGQALSIPKDTTGPVESLRMLQITRNQLVATAAKLVTLIKSLLITAPVNVRQRYTAMTTPTLIATLSRCRPSSDLSDPINGTLTSLKTLATTYNTLRAQCDELDNKITDLVEVINPEMTQIFGCRAINAAELIVSVGENPKRIRSQAALAHLWGVAPILASSGRTNRHRLNRGGDRHANAALHRIVLVRMCHDERTRDYVQRRTREGLSKKEIMRCLKRAIVREIYQVLCLGRPVKQSSGLRSDEFRALRSEKGLSQTQVARKLGCAPARISDIETGKRRLSELKSTYEEFLQTA